MEFKEVRDKVISALVRLYKEDFDLLVRDVNERSISHAAIQDLLHKTIAEQNFIQSHITHIKNAEV